LFGRRMGWVLLLVSFSSCSPSDEREKEVSPPAGAPLKEHSVEVDQLPSSLVMKNGDCWDFSRIRKPWTLTVVKQDRFVFVAQTDDLKLPHAPLDTRAQQRLTVTVAYDQPPFDWTWISPSRLSELISEGVYVEAPKYSVGDYAAYTDTGKDNFIIYLVDYDKNTLCRASNNLQLPNNSIICQWRPGDKWTATFRMSRQSLLELRRISEEVSDVIANLHCELN